MGILNLIALSYLSVISVVVFLHYFNRRTNLIYVSSLIPWQDIKTDVVTSKLFRINLLFLLQILIVILLSLFLARPYLSTDILVIHGRNKVVVVDTSASMQTLEEDGIRIDQAKEQIRKLIDDMKAEDKMMIISAYSSSEVVVGLTSNKELLQKAVDILKPTDTSSDLEGRVSLAFSYLDNIKNSQLFILTDMDIKNSGPRVAELDPKSFGFFKYGSSRDNVAITSLDTFQDIFHETDEAYITVKNYSKVRKRGTLIASIEGKQLMKSGLLINADEQKTFALRKLARHGVLKVELDTDDALKADNVAYGIIKERKKLISILMVTNSAKLKGEFNKLESAFRQINITTISTDKYNIGLLNNYDMAIFHKFIPDKLPAVNSMFISPGLDTGNQIADQEWNSFLSPKGVAQPVKILDWDDAHPTMKYLTYLDNVKVFNGLFYAPPKDARILIHASGVISGDRFSNMPKGVSNNMPLAFSVNIETIRAVVIGMDMEMFDYDKSNDLPMLIMTLNIIQWLSPLGENLDNTVKSNNMINNQMLTGEMFTIKSEEDFAGLRMISSDGKVVPVLDNRPLDIKNSLNLIGKPEKERDIPLDKKLTEQTFLKYVAIKHAGVYIVKNGEKEDKFVANFFDDSESGIGSVTTDSNVVSETGSFSQSSNNATLSTSKQEISELAMYILYLVPFFLFIEWLYSFLQKQTV